MNIFDLNKDQQKAFNRLRRAYKDCESLDVLFVNQYGTLNAYNKEMIIAFGDDQIEPVGNVVKLTDAYYKCGMNLNTIQTCSGMADDEGSHALGLTDEGFELYNQEC